MTGDHTLQQSWVYLDGQYSRYHEVRLGFMTHALHYGTGLFEDLPLLWSDEGQHGYLLQPQVQLARLERMAEVLRCQARLDSEQMLGICAELALRNRSPRDLCLRFLWFKSAEVIGVRLTGLRDSLAAFVRELPATRPQLDPIGCLVSNWRRTEDNAVPAQGNVTGAYVARALARNEALALQADEAIMLDRGGRVVGGTRGCLGLLSAGTLRTPSLEHGAPDSPARSLWLRLAADQGLAVVERAIDRSEIYLADELMLLDPLHGLVPVGSVDHRAVGSGAAGAITRQLAQAFEAAARGQNVDYRDWLVAV